MFIYLETSLTSAQRAHPLVLGLAVFVCILLALVIVLASPHRAGLKGGAVSGIEGPEYACRGANCGGSSKHNKFEPIWPLGVREDIVRLLQEEGFKVGAEIGVQQGFFAESTLNIWTKCTKYYLIDPWKHQKNYDDVANVPQNAQEELYQETLRRLKPWKSKTKVLRMYSSEAVKYIKDNELDYVYIDARHDYCGVKEDIELYWPKVKSGGIMAGHDYVTAPEISNQDWSRCADGTINQGAVRGAVDEFATKMDLQVTVTYNEWPSWLFRKP